MDLGHTIIAFLYACTGIVGAIGYLPTIKDLMKGKKSANVPSYIVWTLTTGIALIYIIVVTPDILLEIVTALNLAACALILLLAVKLEKTTSVKKKKRKKFISS